jgi:SAM-dependent methyltransferase
MPVNEKDTTSDRIYQRDQYAKGGLGKLYWDLRDRLAFSFLTANHRDIADLGCGEGITLEKLRAIYPDRNVFGMDILQENIDICRKHGLPVRQGSIYHLDLPDQSIDAALFMEVIEHLDRPEAALREIHRVLRPGGRAVIVFPNDCFFKCARLLTLRFKEASYDPGHVRQWTPRGASAALRQVGFRTIGSRNAPFFLWVLSLHCVMCAEKPS